MIGPTVCEIIRSYIRKDGEKPKDRVARLKDTLDRNITPKKVYYAPADYVKTIVSRVMEISSPNLINNYASMCGYVYDRKRKAYKVPERVTPSAQYRLDDEAEQVLKITTDHAEKVRKERADSVSSTSSDLEDRPGSSPGPRTSRKGGKSGKVRAAHHMIKCPGCKEPIHSNQPAVMIKTSSGDVLYHKECAPKRTVEE